jgi:hypothetical protein
LTQRKLHGEPASHALAGVLGGHGRVSFLQQRLRFGAHRHNVEHSHPAPRQPASAPGRRRCRPKMGRPVLPVRGDASMRTAPPLLTLLSLHVRLA